jgi:tetratricopeptide (TPR) repeat protein/predicted Ser/Thr protein kinase
MEVTEKPILPPPEPLVFLPGQTFAGRFTIIERIAVGGMGVVYKAIDTELDSTVALKLIQPALAQQSSFVDRLRREARVTRQLTHPNVCRVHDLGNAEGVFYLSMEFIEGETLQQLLRQTGTFNPSRAVEIASKIAVALEAAHERGIVHRDLKPGNVMIGARGNVHVLDFGLAREEGAEALTGVGVAVGTPLYMSPEQRSGAEVDPRSDLYALGLILLEMLTGRRSSPEPGLTDNLPPEVNPLIGPVLRRLLAWEPDKRYSSAAELRPELEELSENPSISNVASSALIHARTSFHRRFRGPLIAVAALVVLAASIYAFMRLNPPPSPAVDLLPAEAQQLYARGLQLLREELETTEGIGEAITFFHKADNVAPDSPVVMARLAEGYFRQYEKDKDVAVREEAERWLRRAEYSDPSLPEVRHARALGLILEGKYDAAKTKLEQAVTTTPDFAAAWAALGLAHAELGEYTEGIDALDKAMQHEPGSFRMHLYRGNFHYDFQEYSEAASFYELAAELKPDSFMAWNNVAASLLDAGRYKEAIPALERSLEIEDSSYGRSNLGTVFFALQRYEDAVEEYRRATDQEPRVAVYWGNLGDALQALGRSDEAGEAYRAAVDAARDTVLREPLNPDALIALAVFCAHTRDEKCAIENADAAVQLQPENAIFALRNARILCIFDRREEALDWLDRAVKLGASRGQIENYPELGRLEDDPRYAEILGLPVDPSPSPEAD